MFRHKIEKVFILGTMIGLTFHNALANEASYELIENENVSMLKVKPLHHTFDPIVISADCRTEDRRYLFQQLNPDSGSLIKFRNLLVYVREKHYSKSGAMEEKTLIEISADLQIGRPQTSLKRPPMFSLDQEKILSLVELCRSKFNTYANVARTKARTMANRRQELINRVRELHNLEPMLSGNNQIRIDDLVTEFLNYGHSQGIGKFVWFYDGTYRVDQVLEDSVILKSKSYTGLLPVTIFTEKEVLENQRWSAVSGSPLKFIGVDSYQTVIGARQQTLVFEHLWKNKAK